MHRPRTSLLAVAACLATTGCDVLLGLGTEPDGVELTGASSASATSSTSTNAAATASAAISSSAITSSATDAGAGGSDQGGAGAQGGGGTGGQGGAGAGGSGTGGGGTGGSGTGGGGGTGGSGGTDAVCDAPEPEVVACGSCDVDCADCNDTSTLCRLRTVAIGGTSRVTDAVSGIVNRFGRGIVASPEFIAFTRTRAADGQHVVTVVNTMSWQDHDAAPSLAYLTSSIAGDPLGQTVLITSVAANPPPILILSDATKEQPVLGDLAVAPPSEGFGAITWDESTYFVGVGRDDAAFFHFDSTLPDAPCAIGDPISGGIGIAIVTRSVGNEVSFLAPHFQAAAVTVEETPRPTDLCPASVPDATAQVASTASQVNGVAASCGRTIVQTVRPSGLSGRAFRMDDPTKFFATYPSQAIGASNDRVYLAHPGGGVARCNGDLRECVLLASGAQIGVVSLIAATANGFVSVGFSDASSATANAVVACYDELL